MNVEKGLITINSSLVKEAVDNLLPEKILNNIKNYKLEIKDGQIIFSFTKYWVANIEVVINITDFIISENEKTFKGNYVVEKGRLMLDVIKWMMELDKENPGYIQILDNEFQVNLEKSDKVNLISNYLTISNLNVENNYVKANVCFTKK